MEASPARPSARMTFHLPSELISLHVYSLFLSAPRRRSLSRPASLQPSLHHLARHSHRSLDTVPRDGLPVRRVGLSILPFRSVGLDHNSDP
jgi:hypothetical protein